MKEEYVNEEVTKKLIDKGCPVRLVIKADEHSPILYELPKEHPDWQYCKAWYIPTISQVLKWLREEKKIHIVIDITNYGFISSIISFKWDKSYCENEIENYDHKGYSTYEEATIAGIEYVLDNLI